MIKKIASISMLFSALAIMLAHNIIAHHHHDHEEVSLLSNESELTKNSHSHSHQHDHKHSYDQKRNDQNEGQNESDQGMDWYHFLLNVHHGDHSLSFLKGNNLDNNTSNFNPFSICNTIEVYLVKGPLFYFSKIHPHFYFENQGEKLQLPFGLRAPPFIVVS